MTLNKRLEILNAMPTDSLRAMSDRLNSQSFDSLPADQAELLLLLDEVLSGR